MKMSLNTLPKCVRRLQNAPRRATDGPHQVDSVENTPLNIDCKFENNNNKYPNK